MVATCAGYQLFPAPPIPLPFPLLLCPILCPRSLLHHPGFLANQLWLGFANGRHWQEIRRQEERELATFLPCSFSALRCVSGTSCVSPDNGSLQALLPHNSDSYRAPVKPFPVLVPQPYSVDDFPLLPEPRSFSSPFVSFCPLVEVHRSVSCVCI